MCTAISPFLKEEGGRCREWRCRRGVTDEPERVSAHGWLGGLEEEDEDCEVPSACMSYHVCVARVAECVYVFDNVTVTRHASRQNQLHHPQQTAT